MRAAVLHGFGDLRIEQVPDPRPGPGEALVEVACVQVSVTEAMLIAGEPVALHTQVAQRLSAGPVRFGGHEVSGVLASAAPGFAVGDPVTVVETVRCGGCAPCRVGRECRTPDYLGFTVPGGFAERMVVPVANLVRVPDGITAAQAAAVQPLVGAMHAHEAADIHAGQVVVAIGCGVMGLHAVRLAVRAGATVVAIGRSRAGLALARSYGARVIASADEPAVLDLLESLTDGQGADVVIETAGGAQSAGLAGSRTVDLAARLLRRRGRLVLVSVLPDEARLPLAMLRNKAITVVHPPNGPTLRDGSSAFADALRRAGSGEHDLSVLARRQVHGIDALPEAVARTLAPRPAGELGAIQVHLPVTWPAATG